MIYKGDITRREVMLECLEIIRQQWRITSKSYNCLEPKAGMEIEFWECMKKATTLQRIIQAMESEKVREAIAAFLEEKPETELAQWQKDLMAGKQPDIVEGTTWNSGHPKSGNGSGTPA